MGGRFAKLTGGRTEGGAGQGAVTPPHVLLSQQVNGITRRPQRPNGDPRWCSLGHTGCGHLCEREAASHGARGH